MKNKAVIIKFDTVRYEHFCGVDLHIRRGLQMKNYVVTGRLVHNFDMDMLYEQLNFIEDQDSIRAELDEIYVRRMEILTWEPA